MTQLPLFTTCPPPPHCGTDTSREAAEQVEPYVNAMHDCILDSIRLHDGSTCDELEERLRMRHQTASARIRELVQMGKLRNSGERRKTRSGRGAVVWEGCGG